MKLLVCVKQVLEPETALKVAPDGKRIAFDFTPRYQMNHFDEFVVEAAVLMKEARTADTVHVLTLGPDRVRPIIDRALGMGVDQGIHIRDPREALFDPLQVAGLLAAYISTRDYDLILTGVMSEDGMHGQVGPMLAEMLGRPWATAVVAIQASDDGSVRVEREVEGGRRIEMDVALPAVLTIQSGINQPRYPALSKLLKAKSRPPELIESDSLVSLRSRQTLERLALPQKKRDGVVLEGNTREKADRLWRILEEKGLA